MYGIYNQVKFLMLWPHYHLRIGQSVSIILIDREVLPTQVSTKYLSFSLRLLLLWNPGPEWAMMEIPFFSRPIHVPSKGINPNVGYAGSYHSVVP